MKCRYCKTELSTVMTDLGFSPLSNDYLSVEQIEKGQHYLPLKVFFCQRCKLVQTSEYKEPNSIFNSEYKYYSSYSKSWLEHSRKYVEMISKRLELTKDSKVMEIASNDGYLLQYFVQMEITPIGVDPSEGTANAAKEKGVNTIVDYFGKGFAECHLTKHGKYDLILGNNVLAHVPDIRNFVEGLKILLKENGTITMEFPHLLNLIRFNQFDTIYHEHFSYLSITFVKGLFESAGLKLYDIEKLNTHGGSLRIYATHIENESITVFPSVNDVLVEEKQFGIDADECYRQFDSRVKQVKFNTLKLLSEIKLSGKKIAGYGAAAKGNTLLNYCGIRPDMIDFVADLNPNKVGLFLPGSLIPVVEPEEIKKEKPDYIIVFPWNLEQEIVKQLDYIREWGGKFIVLIPEVRVF